MPATHMMLECYSCKHSSQGAFPTSAHQLEYGIGSPREDLRAAQLGARVVQSPGEHGEIVHIGQKPSKHHLCSNSPLFPLAKSWLFLQAQLDVLLLKANGTDVAVFECFLPFPPPEGNSKPCVSQCRKDLCSLKT